MKIICSIFILLFLSVSINNVIAQSLTNLEVSTGLLNDSNNCFGLKLGVNKTFKSIEFGKGKFKQPLSIFLNVGYFKYTNREGFNDFKYSYFSNQNIVTSIGVNYVLYTFKNNSFSISPRFSYYLNEKNYYSSLYNNARNRNEVFESTEKSNDFSFGASINYKKTNRKNKSLVLSAGLDYLVAESPKLIKTAMIGFEVPLRPLTFKNRKVVVNNVKKEIVFKQPQIVDEKKQNINKTITPQVSEPSEINNPILNEETNTRAKNTNLIKDTLAPKVNKSNKLVKGPIVISKSKNDQEKTKIEIKEPIVIKKEKAIKSQEKVDIKADSVKIIKPKKKSIFKEENNKTIIKEKNNSELKEDLTVNPILKVIGPLNVNGVQYELGDDWNYWLGENGFWYAKRKSNSSWYDLLKSLSDQNYEKAIQKLGADAKKVD
jgi:hypothetical protein